MPVIQEEDNTKRPALRFDPTAIVGKRSVTFPMYLLNIQYKHIKAASIKGLFQEWAPESSGCTTHQSPSHSYYDQTLGFEGLAPMYGNTTDYLDDHKIPTGLKTLSM